MRVETQKLTELALAIFIIKLLWDVVTHFLINKDLDLKTNTEAVIKLTVRMDSFEKTIIALMALNKDLNEAHTKIRVIESKMEN